MQRAEPPLLVERVDFDHDPVDLVVELDPLLFPGATRFGDRRDRFMSFRERVRAETVISQPLQRVPVAIDRKPVAHAEPVDPDRQRTLSRGRRVLLAEGACRGVARIRCRLLPFGDETFVQRVESAQREIHLSANLEQRRRLFLAGVDHPHRDRLDRLEIRCDVLAAVTVASGRAADERTVLVDEVDRETVDLRLGDIGDVTRPESLADVLVPLLQRLVRGYLFERAHRRRVLDLLERCVGESGVTSFGSDCSSATSSS